MVNEECINNENDCHVPPVNKKLWIIEFDIRMGGKGCAVVQANNPSEAISVLSSNGMYNGVSYSYSINRVEEIIPAVKPMILAEQIVGDNAIE